MSLKQKLKALEKSKKEIKELIEKNVKKRQDNRPIETLHLLQSDIAPDRQAVMELTEYLAETGIDIIEKEVTVLGIQRTKDLILKTLLLSQASKFYTTQGTLRTRGVIFFNVVLRDRKLVSREEHGVIFRSKT